jgi:UrcA family protein
MEKTMLKVLAAAALASAGLAAAANAQSDVQSPARPEARVAVSYADLNLASPAGAERMLDRIERAAEKACGGRGTQNRLLEERYVFRDCVRAAVADAVFGLNAPMVTAAYEGRPSVNLASVSE